MPRQVVPSVNPSRELPVQPPAAKISHHHPWTLIAARSRAGAAARSAVPRSAGSDRTLQVRSVRSGHEMGQS